MNRYVSEDRQQALEDIMTRMRAQGITLSDLSQAMGVDQASGGKMRAWMDGTITRVFSNLGGILIFAGLSAYLGMFWQEMSVAMRIVMTLGIGLALHAAALIAMRNPQYKRMVQSLLLIACALQTTGWFVLFQELFPNKDDYRPILLTVFAVMGLQQISAFYKFRLTLMLYFSLIFFYAFIIVLLDVLHANEKAVLIALGISMISLARGISTTPHASLAVQGYFLGGCLFYWGLFALLKDTPLELLYFGATVASVYASTVLRSNALLTVSTLAMLCYICYFTEKHFVHSVGWPLSLVMLGGVFFGISSYALRVRRRYITNVE